MVEKERKTAKQRRRNEAYRKGFADGLALAKTCGAPITPAELAAFKYAFYNNAGDETDDPFVKAFEAIGWSASSAEPPTGIAREAYGVRVSFVADCLRTYADILRRGRIDAAGHYFPIDIEEAADMLEAGDIELLEAAIALVGSLMQTPEHAEAMARLRAAVESLS